MAKMNMKKLATEHIEKGVFGLFVVIVLLALMGTKWSPYKGTAREITDKVAQGKKALKSHVWPQEEMEKYTFNQEKSPANIVNERLRKEFSPSQVEVSGKMVVDPFGGNEPVTEPVLSAPQDAIASSARVFISIFDESKLTPEVTDPATMEKPKNEDDDSDLPDELRKNVANRGEGMGMDGMMGPQSYGSMVQLEMMNPMDGMMGMPGMEGEMGGPAGPQLKGEGYHFVSVRAVFPLREQITNYAEAINKSFHYAAATFDIRNFELERQTAQLGEADPWSGPWEPVDMKVAEDILMKADGFDAEVVNPMITNAVITMPLPMRISGRWDRQATHPRIEKFTLSDSEIALEQEMQYKLLKEAANQQKMMDSQVVKRGGFSTMTIDPRQLNQDMLGVGMYQSGGMGMGGMPGMGMGMGMGGGMGGASGMNRPRGPGAQVDPVQKLISDMAKGSTNKAEEEERIRKWISSMVSAEGELLLFRYLDFNVEPGKTYRYRVRFIVANPNYGKRIADAGGLNHVVEGETRETPWSNVTRPVTVDRDVKYFLTEIVERFPRILPTVSLDVFEWAQQHGTLVNSILEVRFGQQLTQEKETLVMDPAKYTSEKQKFEFKSTDYLVDALDEIRVDEAFHEQAADGTAFKFPVGSRGKIWTSPKILISSVNRELKYMNPALSQREYKQQKDYLKAQEEQLAYLNAPKETETDAALMELGLSGVEGDPAMSTKKSKGRGPRSQMRINSGMMSEGMGPAPATNRRGAGRRNASP